MTTPGWYPDPEGQPEQYRYFDGQTWSTQTSDDPARPAPGSTDRQDGPVSVRTKKSGWRPWVLILAAGAALLGLLAAGSLSPPDRADRDDDATGDPPLVSPTAPAYDSTSPTFRADPRPCPTGDPTQRARHRDDGRVHGGRLSFTRIDGFRPPGTSPTFGFAWDVQQQATIVHANADWDTPGWTAQFAVGRLREADGFDVSSRVTASRMLGCVLRSDAYRGFTPVARITRSGNWTLGTDAYGRSGHYVAAEILIDNPVAGYPGDRLEMVVVPDGRDYSFFLSAVPIGNSELADQARQVLESLRAT